MPQMLVLYQYQDLLGDPKWCRLLSINRMTTYIYIYMCVCVYHFYNNTGLSKLMVPPEWSDEPPSYVQFIILVNIIHGNLGYVPLFWMTPMPTTDGFFLLIECLKLNLSIERISKSKSLDVSLPILIHFDQALCANDVLMATVAALYTKRRNCQMVAWNDPTAEMWH